MTSSASTDTVRPNKHEIPHLLDMFTVNLVLLTLRLLSLGCLTAMLVLLIACGASDVTTTTVYAAENDAKTSRVLFLNSYNRGYKWSDDIERGLLERFQSSDRKVEMSVEFLDSRRFPDNARFDSLAETLAVKYAGYRHDLVVVSDNFSFDLATQYRKQLFPELPIVFCGYNNFRPEVIKGISNITGVNEEVDISKTVHLAIKVQPSVRTLAFIISTRDASSKLIAEIAEALVIPKYRHNYKIIVLKDAPMSEIQSRLGSLTKDSAVILAGQTSDRKEGRELTPEENGRIISAVSPVPVYSFWDFHLGTGILGGHIITGIDQGRASADLALRILGGVPATKIPVVMETPARDIFDFNAMKRFGISDKALPEGSSVINRPDSAWERYKSIILGTIGFFMVMSLIIIILIINILKRRQAENELRKEKQLLETFFKSLPGAAYVFGEDGRFIRWNRYYETTLGYTPEDMTRLTALETVAPADRERVSRVIEKGLREGFCEAEFNCLTADGRLSPSYGVGWAIELEGKRCITGIAVDLSERKKLEEQLRNAQKMEAIGTLAGGIAHDFNNILSPIIGYTELAKRLAADNPKLSGYLSQVGEAASRAADLARQILTFSRKTEQQKLPLQVSPVVKEALKLLRSSIPTSIEIRQEIVTQALVLADPTQIHQIVMNLCTNAYHSMEKTGGVLAVSLKEVEMLHEKILGGEITPGRYVVLEVSDTGCGMDQETQAKIFEPYFTTKETGKGTGLGLAVVHGIVKDHQGMINVYSELGKGTTFRVYLPTTEDQMHITHARHEEAIPTKMHEHILFVDDDERICGMAKDYLSEYGYSVDVCSNGRDALFVIEQNLNAYDLLITDMTMPGINGKELAKRVLAMRPDLPVILCTGYSSLINREEAATIGISAYIEKPVTMNDLVGKIQIVLQNNSQ